MDDNSLHDGGNKKGQSNPKRKREAVGATKSNKKHHGSPLESMILAVSTHDGIENEAQTRDVSYSTVAKSCRDAGATVSGQVHKRVCYLICTPAAVLKATQRIRKAIEKGIPLVDVAWVQQCLEENQKVDHTEFCLDALFEANIGQDTLSKVNIGQNHQSKGAEAQASILPDQGGWSEAVDLGCCCVCHENGADDCEWCVECSLNMQKKQPAK